MIQHPASQLSQDDVIAFLAGPDAFGETSELVETHCALVFLTKTTAYKLKRAVKYDYLDYSTRDIRHKMLIREIELNKPTAPSIYRDVIPVTLESDGRLALRGEGEPIEWLLRMTRFPASDELAQIADNGGLTDPVAFEMGAAVAQYHKGIPQREANGAALIHEIMDELTSAFVGMNAELGYAKVSQFATDVHRAFDGVTDLLLRRTQDGKVRRCHGDLHLRNLVMIDGVPTPFDALEFDERLGTCDVLYDLAFLLMDLIHRGLPHAANLVLNGYVQMSQEFDPAALRTFPLFLSIRAAIRAMVEVQGSRLQPDNTAQRADGLAYLDQALGYLDPLAPRLLIIGGLSGTGKTTIARAIAHQLGPAPGAIHLRSDVLRKQIFATDPLTHLPAEAYQPEVTAKVYAKMRGVARDCLMAGHSVILDATYLSESERDASEAVARTVGCAFTGIWLQGDMDVLTERVLARENDASDADVSVLRDMAQRDLGDITWNHVSCDGSTSETVSRTLRVLGLDA